MVADRLETFLDEAQSHGHSPPWFVERELRQFLKCGIYAYGFLRVYCDDCRTDRWVPFSCKGRGFCSSCGGRRMSDTAAHLVDRVLPHVHVRQWVLSLPYALRYRMAYDAELTGDVLRIFVRRVFASVKRRARARWGIKDPQCGAVTFVQRFGGALNLNVHFHTLVMDGVFDPAREMRFRHLPPPDEAEIESIVRTTAGGILRLLKRRGLGADAEPDQADPVTRDAGLMAALYSASVRGQIATGPRTGQKVMRFGDYVEVEHLEAVTTTRCVTLGGLSLHANVAVPAGDRQRLERVCRYVARPPVATERLKRLPDGRLMYELRHPWRDGTTHVAFLPLELVEKLAALVPPPRVNLVRYHGVLAPAARHRSKVVPEVEKPEEQECLEARTDSDTEEEKSIKKPRNYSWAELMRRVFAIDVLECPKCQGRMRVLTAIHSPEAIQAILKCLGLPGRPPPIAPPDPRDFYSDSFFDVC